MTKYELRITGECKQNLKLLRCCGVPGDKKVKACIPQAFTRFIIN